MKLVIDLPDPQGVFELQVVMEASEIIEPAETGVTVTGIHVADSWVRYRLKEETEWTMLPAGKLNDELTRQALSTDLKAAFQKAVEDAIDQEVDRSRQEF